MSERNPDNRDKPSAWRTGHLPHIPRDPSEEDPVTGWLRERLLDGLPEVQADDAAREDPPERERL